MAARKLNNRQKRFADELLICGNASEAARRAGYSEKYAHTNVSKLLQNTTLQEYIKERRKVIDAGKVADAKERRESLTKVLRDNARDGDWQAVIKAADILNKMDNLYTQRIEAKTSGVMDVRVVWGGDADDEDDKD